MSRFHSPSALLQPRSMRRSLFLLPFALVSGSALAGGTALEWPGAAPCNTTLQACIDASASGSTITIVTSDPIDETLNIPNRSFTLRGGDGVYAQFAPGNNLFVGVAPISADVNVTLERLQLTDGYVAISVNNPGNSTFALRGLTVRQSSPVAPPAYISVRVVDGSIDAELRENRVIANPAGLNGGLVRLENDGAALDARVYYNTLTRLTETSTDGAGVFMDVVRGGTGRVRLHGNTIRGGFGRGGIFASEGLFSSTPSDYDVRAYNNVVIGRPGGETDEASGTGIGFAVHSGRISAQAINNTITRVANGISALRWNDGADSAAVEGIVANNVIVARRGLLLALPLLTLPTNDYNLINASSNIATLGTHTITAPAALEALDAPRPRPESPAVDAADTTLLGLGIILNAMSLNDADGLRRLKGPSPLKADIGAYELGDTSVRHVARSGNIISHTTTMTHPSLDAVPNANPFATPARNAGIPNADVLHNAPLGVYYGTERWRVFSEDFSAMPLHARFNMFVPAPGGGVLQHTATDANRSLNYTRIDDEALEELDDRIVLVTQRWTTEHLVYNPHPIGLFYNGTNWFIDNLDNATMPLNAVFNVYVQEPSPNAFRVVPTEGESVIRIPHPLLDGNPCALPMVTRQYDGDDVATHFDVRYDDGGWSIDTRGVGVTAGTQFHVLVNPAQASRCALPMFADGFETP